MSRNAPAVDQRDRLLEAMIDIAAEEGYLNATVADVASRAGVSRKTFYRYFASKQECVLDAYDAITAVALSRVMAASEAAQGIAERTGSALDELLRQAVINPPAVRLALVEISSLGSVCLPRRERNMEAAEGLLRPTLQLPTPDQPGLDPLLRGIVGGVNDMLQARARSSEESLLSALSAELVGWMTSYYPVPPEIATPSKPPQKLPNAGGRAPGTLSPPRSGPALTEDRGSSRSFLVHNQRERVLDAVANLSAANGYASVTVRKIAAQAAVSLDVFYRHFIDKDDAFLVTYQVGHGHGIAIVEHAYRAAPDWRTGVRAAIEALFGFLASEPSFARLALVDAPLAGPNSAEHARAGRAAYARILLPGLEETRRRGQPMEIAVEAIAGGIFEICLTLALQGRLDDLPSLVRSTTYFALAPFIGPTEATRVATVEAE